MALFLVSFFFQLANSHSVASFTVLLKFLLCAWISGVVKVVRRMLKVLSLCYLKVF